VACSLSQKVKADTQAVRSINDGIGYLNVAGGATKELKNILFRLRELSTQISNGSYRHPTASARQRDSSPGLGANAGHGESEVVPTPRPHAVEIRRAGGISLCEAAKRG
jgi:hypothetical protein